MILITLINNFFLSEKLFEITKIIKLKIKNTIKTQNNFKAKNKKIKY